MGEVLVRVITKGYMALFIRHKNVKAPRHQGTKTRQTKNIPISTRGALLHHSSINCEHLLLCQTGGYYVPGNAQLNCIQWFPEKRRLILTWPVLVSKFKVRRIDPLFPKSNIKCRCKFKSEMERCDIEILSSSRGESARG